RAVDRSYRDLAPRTASGKHHAVDDDCGRRLVCGIGDRRLREHTDIIRQVDDGGAGRGDVAVRGRLEKRLEDDRVVIPFDAHWRAVDGPVACARGDDRLDNHRTSSTAGGTNTCVASSSCTWSSPSAPVAGTGSRVADPWRNRSRIQ